jgi:transcriptional regulator with XRE-family HTH domain
VNTAEDDLRDQVRAAIAAARISQAEIARRLNLTPKHLSHMLTGRATLTLGWAEAIAAVCGLRIVISLAHDTLEVA